MKKEFSNQFHYMNASVDSYTADNGDNVQVFYSYYTPILIGINGKWYTSNKKYSRTTSKQKTIFINETLNPVIMNGERLNNIITTIEHNDFKNLVRGYGLSLGLA